MKLRIQHETHYHYESPVNRSIQYLRLRPFNTPQQRILNWELQAPGEMQTLTDGFGNSLTVLTVDHPITTLTLVATGTVELTGKALSTHDSTLAPEVFLRPTPLTTVDDALSRFANGFGRNKRSLTRLMKTLSDRIAFTPGATTVRHTAAEVFALKAGVCQDHTHVFLACCRHLGVPARYVSGYVQSDDESHLATHAWAEVYLGRSWHTFDVVNNKQTADNHLKLAIGLDYQDAAPVRGVRHGGGTETMSTRALVSQLGNQ